MAQKNVFLKGPKPNVNFRPYFSGFLRLVQPVFVPRQIRGYILVSWSILRKDAKFEPPGMKVVHVAQNTQIRVFTPKVKLKLPATKPIIFFRIWKFGKRLPFRCLTSPQNIRRIGGGHGEVWLFLFDIALYNLLRKCVPSYLMTGGNLGQ